MKAPRSAGHRILVFAADAVRTELRVLSAARRALLRRPIAPSEITFTRKSSYPSVALSLGILIVLEAIPVHLLLRGHAGAQSGLLALDGYALLWLVGDLRALHESTCRFDRGGLAIQLGFRGSARIPFHVLDGTSCGEPTGRTVDDEAHLTPGDTPNVRFALRRPIVVRGFWGLRRRAKVLRLYVDDPEILLARLESSASSRRVVESTLSHPRDRSFRRSRPWPSNART